MVPGKSKPTVMSLRTVDEKKVMVDTEDENEVCVKFTYVY